MSKIFSKLKDLSMQRSQITSEPTARSIPMAPAAPLTPTATIAAASQTNQFPIVLVLSAILVIGALLFLGILLFNAAVIKNQTLVSINQKIQQQHNQILLLNKKLIVEQSYVENRIRKVQSATNDLNDSVQAKLSDIDSLKDKFDSLNNNVESRLGQTSTNMNRIEAVLQSNIDELNTKFNKLQTSAPVSSDAGEQTKTVSGN